MKIRLGFVSNSSSSSFVICGIDFSNREDLLKAYELVRSDLTEDDRDRILDSSTSDWDLPEFPGLTVKSYEYDDITVGVQTDPECMGVEDCMNGFVDEKEKELLKLLSSELGLPITTQGGTEYC